MHLLHLLTTSNVNPACRTCKCFEHLHTFHCEEEEGAPLVRVHCHQALQEEEDGEPHLNYYHQRNTMAAIRTFNKMITHRLGGGGKGAVFVSVTKGVDRNINDHPTLTFVCL